MKPYDFCISFDSENFGEIICFEDGYEIKCKMKFHQFIKKLYEFLLGLEMETSDYTFEMNFDELLDCSPQPLCMEDHIWQLFSTETIT